jgi:hypothetical protein
MRLDLILADAIAGGLAGLIGFFVANRFVNRKEKPQIHLLILIVFVVGGGQIVAALINPYIRAWRAESEIQTFLDSDPLFQGILTDHPELREPLREQFAEAMRTGDREVSARAGRLTIGRVLPEYLAKAPDDAVRGFGEAQLATLKALQSDGDRCFRFANPEVEGGVVLTNEEGRDESEQAVRTLILSARENPITNAGDDGEALLGTVSGKLVEIYGEEVGILATPTDPGLDRERYCEILVSLYETVFELPEAETATVLRYMMGQGASNDAASGP